MYLSTRAEPPLDLLGLSPWLLLICSRIYIFAYAVKHCLLFPPWTALPLALIHWGRLKSPITLDLPLPPRFALLFTWVLYPRPHSYIPVPNPFISVPTSSPFPLLLPLQFPIYLLFSKNSSSPPAPKLSLGSLKTIFHMGGGGGGAEQQNLVTFSTI